MTMPRKLLVDVRVTRYYHCISRCVRRAFLCGKGFEHRKQWIEERLQKLADVFSISVCGFAVMDNHVHVLVRLDPDSAKDWTDEEVIRRWLAVYPPKKMDLNNASMVDKWIIHQAKDKRKVEVIRGRLQNLGWFMKALKEPLARKANKEDDCTGTFWEARYKSIAILDEESLLATCAYIDLNPVAAGLAATPEDSKHTSLRQRIEHAKKKGKLKSLTLAAISTLAASKAAGRFEDSHWLCPLDDGRTKGSAREGMVAGFSLGCYLLLVDYTSRLWREGKSRVSDDLASIFERLGTNSAVWEYRMRCLMGSSRLSGNHFASSRDKLRELAKKKGVHHLDNVIPIKRGSGQLLDR